MNMEKVINLQKVLEFQSNKLKHIINDIQEVQTALAILNGEHKKCGALFLMGKSGKIGDNEIRLCLSINKVGGCVAIPTLMQELALKTLHDLEQECADLIKDVGREDAN